MTNAEEVKCPHCGNVDRSKIAMICLEAEWVRYRTNEEGEIESSKSLEYSHEIERSYECDDCGREWK